jgi:predicted metal-binding protein
MCSAFNSGRNFGSFALELCSVSQFWPICISKVWCLLICVEKCSVFMSGRNFGLFVLGKLMVDTILVYLC